jgi:hypothetical protein
MADQPSSILLLRLMSTGSQLNLWGGYLNTALQTLEQADKGYQALSVTGDATISWTNYSTGNTGQCAFLKLTGTLAASATLTFPTYQNFVLVWNAAGQTVTVKCSGGTGVSIPNGRKTLLFCDGTDYYSAVSTWTGDSTTLTNNGDLVSYSQVVALIAAISTAQSGLVLNSPSATASNYMNTLLDLSNTGLLVAAWSIQNGGTAIEKSLLSLDDRRVRRRALFVGQV